MSSIPGLGLVKGMALTMRRFFQPPPDGADLFESVGSGQPLHAMSDGVNGRPIVRGDR